MKEELRFKTFKNCKNQRQVMGLSQNVDMVQMNFEQNQLISGRQ